MRTENLLTKKLLTGKLLTKTVKINKYLAELFKENNASLIDSSKRIKHQHRNSSKLHLGKTDSQSRGDLIYKEITRKFDLKEI